MAKYLHSLPSNDIHHLRTALPALWILSLYRLSSEPNLRSITNPERWTGYHGLADLVSRYAQCHIGVGPTNAHPQLGQESFLAATRQRAAKYRANQGIEQDTGQRRERLFAGYQRQLASGSGQGQQSHRNIPCGRLVREKLT